MCRIRDLPRKVFKGEIRCLLFDILADENDYIETPVAIQKIGLPNYLKLVHFQHFCFPCDFFTFPKFLFCRSKCL